MAPKSAGLMVVDYQRAFIVAQSLQFVDGNALSGLGLSVAEPVRFEPVVGVQEYEVAPRKRIFHSSEPGSPVIATGGGGRRDRDLFPEIGCAGDEGCFLKCSHLPLARTHHVLQRVEEFRIEVAPSRRLIKVPDVPAITGWTAVGVQPLTHSELLARGKRPQDSQLYEITDISNVAVLHRLVLPRAKDGRTGGRRLG